jgi:hypothetical protein
MYQKIYHRLYIKLTLEIHLEIGFILQVGKREGFSKVLEKETGLEKKSLLT